MYIQQLGLIVGVLAALIVAGMLYQRAASRAASRRFPAPGELIDVGGHKLHVTCSGTGRPPVVLEAGIAASSLSWAAVAPSVAQFTRVCTYDRAGLAWSDVPSCPRTFDRIVEEFATVIARVAPGQRCILVGHSFGSFIVRGYAMRHPDAVAGLVLVDPAVEWLKPDANAPTAFVVRRTSPASARSSRTSVSHAPFSLCWSVERQPLRSGSRGCSETLWRRHLGGWSAKCASCLPERIR